MKTIEKTLYVHGVLITDYISSSAYDATLEAMESYAEQQAIKFAEWANKNYYKWPQGWERTVLTADLPNSKTFLTTEQLYQKFKEEQK